MHDIGSCNKPLLLLLLLLNHLEYEGRLALIRAVENGASTR
jgi:hypothetical protein